MRRVLWWIQDYGAIVVAATLTLALLVAGVVLGSSQLRPVGIVTAPVLSANPTTAHGVPAATVLDDLLSAGEGLVGVTRRAWPGAKESDVSLDPMVGDCAGSGAGLGSLSPVLARSALVSLNADEVNAGGAGTLSGATSTTPTTTLSAAGTSSSLDAAISVAAVGAGLGPRAFAAHQGLAASCRLGQGLAASLGAGPVAAVLLSPPGAQLVEVVTQRGDVVANVSVVVGTTGVSPALTAAESVLGALYDDAGTALSGVCANPAAPASDATRNPSQSDYAPYVTSQTLTPPASIAPPDLSLLNGPLPSVAADPPDSVTSAPVAPSVPSVALSVTLNLASPDTTGPGCGWAFTGENPPRVAVAHAGQVALTQLETQWATWPATVTAYLLAKATYLAALDSYEAWAASTTTTSTTTSTTTTTTPSSTTTSVPPVTSTTLAPTGAQP